MSRWTLGSKLATVIVLAALLLSTALFLQSSQTSSAAASTGSEANVWLTTADLQQHLAQQGNVQVSSGNASGIINITVDENKTYQQMDGFGASLTDGSALLMS